MSVDADSQIYKLNQYALHSQPLDQLQVRLSTHLAESARHLGQTVAAP